LSASCPPGAVYTSCNVGTNSRPVCRKCCSTNFQKTTSHKKSPREPPRETRAHSPKHAHLVPRMGFEARLGRTIGPVPAKFLYEKPQQSARERALVVDSALQPTWRGSPRADCGKNRHVGCAGELPAFCRPARPRARPVSRAAAYGATLPLRLRRAAETRRQAPSPAPPTLWQEADAWTSDA